MAEVWKPKDREILKHWFNDIMQEASDQLTPWEMNFMVAVEKRLDNNNPLTEEQEKKLEEIYAEYTS